MTDLEKKSYALGMNIFGNISELPVEIDMATFLKAVSALSAGEQPALTPEDYQTQMRNFQQEVQTAGQAALKEAAAANVEAGKSFLEENAKKEGVVTTASGLQYRVISEGKGAKPTKSSKVRVHYTGKLLDGTVFDSSIKRGEPTEFGVTQVIAGWTEALMLMTPGSKYELFIPANLAYGDRGAGNVIPPGAALIFEVELLALV